jgi:hypothetical protein
MDTRELAAAVVAAHNRALLVPGTYQPTYAETCAALGLAVEAQ